MYLPKLLDEPGNHEIALTVLWGALIEPKNETSFEVPRALHEKVATLAEDRKIRDSVMEQFFIAALVFDKESGQLIFKRDKWWKRKVTVLDSVQVGEFGLTNAKKVA